MMKTWISETECLINVIEWEPYRPGRYTGPPEDCYPDEGGHGIWEVCDMDGNPDPELAGTLTDRDVLRIEAELFNFMEDRRRERFDEGSC